MEGVPVRRDDRVRQDLLLRLWLPHRLRPACSPLLALEDGAHCVELDIGGREREKGNDRR